MGKGEKRWENPLGRVGIRVVNIRVEQFRIIIDKPAFLLPHLRLRAENIRRIDQYFCSSNNNDKSSIMIQRECDVSSDPNVPAVTVGRCLRGLQLLRPRLCLQLEEQLELPLQLHDPRQLELPVQQPDQLTNPLEVFTLSLKCSKIGQEASGYLRVSAE